MFSVLFHALFGGRAGIPCYITPSLQGGREFAGISRPPTKSKEGGGAGLIKYFTPSHQKFDGWWMGWLMGPWVDGGSSYSNKVSKTG